MLKGVRLFKRDAYSGGGRLVDFSGCQSNSSIDRREEGEFGKRSCYLLLLNVFESVLRKFPCFEK